MWELHRGSSSLSSQSDTLDDGKLPKEYQVHYSEKWKKLNHTHFIPLQNLEHVDLTTLLINQAFHLKLYNNYKFNEALIVLFARKIPNKYV